MDDSIAQATFGLVTSSIFKYLDNITTSSDATSMLIISLVSWAVFDFHMTIAFITGFAIVVLALLLYNLDARTLADALLAGDRRVSSSSGGGGGDDDDEDEEEVARLLP